MTVSRTVDQSTRRLALSSLNAASSLLGVAARRVRCTMADQTTNQELALSLALAEPTQRVRRGWVAGLSLASLGMWMAAYTPLQVLLPTQLQNITPSGKIVALAVVTGVGAVASALATPLAGALSDRTTHRFAFGRMTG